MSDDARPLSPGALAWRRLARSRAARLAGVVLAVVAIACVFAPLAGDPQRQHPWLGPQPPGATQPDCLADNVLEVGRAAQVAPGAAGARHLDIDATRPGERADYRIVARRDGTVRSITRLPGADAVPSLDLGHVAALELRPDGSLGASRDVVGLRVGEPAPAWFAGRAVVMLRVAAPERALHAAATLRDGIVERLEVDGAEAPSIRIGGDRVAAVRADGRALTLTHPLGTDTLGRDLLARVLAGGRISLAVGAVATLVSLLIGVVYGAVAGYCGALSPRAARLDRAMMGAVDILYAIPFMFLVIVLLVNFGRNAITLFAALGAVQWLTMARIVRGQVLSLAAREFVSAARLCGAGHLAIVFRHLIPNTLGIVVVYATLTVPAVILQESFLAFIGLHVQWQGVDLDSWGALIKSGMDALDSSGGRWWLLIAPSLAMSATLVALNALGDALRDALDPHLKGRG